MIRHEDTKRHEWESVYNDAVYDDLKIDLRRLDSKSLAAISHDLYTPLNAILGFAEIIEKEIIGEINDCRYRDYAGNIKLAGQQLQTIFDNAINLLDVKVPRSEPVLQQCSLASLVTTAMKDADISDETKHKLLANIDETLTFNCNSALMSETLRQLLNYSSLTPVIQARVIKGYLLCVIGFIDADASAKITVSGHNYAIQKRLAIVFARTSLNLHGGGLKVINSKKYGFKVCLRLPVVPACRLSDARGRQTNIRQLPDSTELRSQRPRSGNTRRQVYADRSIAGTGS